MSQSASRLTFTFDDYLPWENQQAQRHEFMRGEVFAMTGATDRHNEISMNFAILLRQHLRGTPCRAYMAEVKLRVEAADCSFYPDLQVTCAGRDHADRYVKRSPVRWPGGGDLRRPERTARRRIADARRAGVRT